MSGGAVNTPASFGHAARLTLIVPLALERRCLSSEPSNPSGTVITISQSGQGAKNAARAARAAIEQGATALMSIGVAGGLVERISTGDVVVPDRVIDSASGRTFGCSESWSSALRQCSGALGSVHSGTLLSVTDVLGTPEAKSSAAHRYGSIACDMESAAVASIAHEAQVHFAVLRVISDAYSDRLPNNVAGWVDNSGNARVRPVLGAMMSPGRWRTVISMATRFRLAQRRLSKLSEILVAAAYCCPKVPGG
jgi:adenosylhomocysteine nucleosidase